MRNFVFHNPTKYVFGKDTVKLIGQEIRNFGSKKVLLVAGRGSIKKNGVYDTVIKSLKDNSIEWVELWGVRPNPVLSKVKEGIKLAKEHGVDGVLAVGGGSTIDTAKAIANGMFVDDVWKLYLRKNPIKPNKALPIYVVLTLSATGSEMNGTSVITNEEEKVKWSYRSITNYPKVSIVDPTVQFSLPRIQTANGGSDSLSHILETYLTGKPTDTTVYFDEGLMKSIIDNIDILIQEPDNYEARASFAWAATLAFNGLSLTGLGGDWAAHAIEHAISALHPDVAHGSGLAVIQPAVVLYREKFNKDITQRWAREIFNVSSTEAGVEKLREKFSSWGLPISLKELGVSESEWEEIAIKAIEFRPKNSWGDLTKEDVFNILRLADI